MKLLSVVALSIGFLGLISSPAMARENCEAMAKKAALYISQTVNVDGRQLSLVDTLSNDASSQVVEVTVDDVKAGGGMHISYTVTVERNASPIEANQTCQRVTKIELTSEE